MTITYEQAGRVFRFPKRARKRALRRRRRVARARRGWA